MTVEVRKPTKADIDRVKAEKWGIWEKEVSEFPYEYDERETCLIIEGEVAVTCFDGESVKFGPGDWVVFPQGLECTWKITKPVRKYYRFG